MEGEAERQREAESAIRPKKRTYLCFMCGYCLREWGALWRFGCSTLTIASAMEIGRTRPLLYKRNASITGLIRGGWLCFRCGKRLETNEDGSGK